MKNMNLYLISQSVNTDYDTYDAAIVAAPDAATARRLDPANGELIPDDREGARNWHGTYAWCKPEKVSVELIGKARPGTKQGVILASFNAG